MTYFTASTFRRTIAFVIDQVIILILFLPVGLESLNSYLVQGNFSVDLRWILACFLMKFFYQWLFLYFLGGTLGKLTMGVRLIPIHAGENLSLGLMQSFIRVLADELSLFFGQGLKMLALLRLDRTHVSDWVAETRVVQFHPRLHRPRRRVILGIGLCFILSMQTLKGVYSTLQKTSLQRGQLVIDATD